ncbi:putative Zn-dependent protease [Paenibacillus phyllosphaerae]|uniref:Putative Zn-dependent protease n=1 Tax=Paenibacillus phyllosphaerae TaxID=274593 RepID=A0A7W5ASZ2_9BACL|nr:matrixin family metalloprotease [Paenibacillus phyllosphaerae]MBB3108098.1 putative Zn-dependent protease [Paenibacillus phyllosphaerae]
MDMMKFVSKNKTTITMIALGIVVFVGTSYVSTVQAKGLGYRWYSKTTAVQFNVPFNDTWKTPIQAAMSSWNNVADANTSDSATSLPKLSVTTTDVENDFYTVNSTSYPWSGKMFPTKYTSGGKEYLSATDIAFNLRYSFTNGAEENKIDIQVNAAHELGHALGVAHCHEEGETHNSGDSNNTMYPSVFFNTTYQRSLESYDTASFQLIYWD